MKRLYIVLFLLFLIPITPVYAKESPITYTIDESSINEDGLIDINLQDTLTKLSLNGFKKAGDTKSIQVQIKNTLPYDIQLSDYDINTSSHNVTPLSIPLSLRNNFETKGTLNSTIKGFNNQIVPVQLNCLRCPNMAIAMLYQKKQSDITLEDLLNVEKRIQEAYPTLNTYKDYLCFYYHVDTLSELSNDQINQIIAYQIPYVKDKGNMNLTDEKVRQYVIYKDEQYYVYEYDKDIVSLGHDYYYKTLMMFSFDTSLKSLSSDHLDYSLMSYFDNDSSSKKDLDEYLNQRTIHSNELMTFTMQLRFSKTWGNDIYLLRGIPTLLNIDLSFKPMVIDGYAFDDINQNGLFDEGEVGLKDVKIDLWKNKSLVETTKTDEKGYYSFEPIDSNDEYYIQASSMNQYVLSDYNDQRLGNRFKQIDQSIQTLSFTQLTDKQRYNVAYTKKTYPLTYDFNGGSGELIEVSQYFENQEINVSTISIYKSGYRFIGWNTKKDGSGILYTSNDTIKMPSHALTLYACFQEVDVPVSVLKTNQEVITSDELSVVIGVLFVLSLLGIKIVIKGIKDSK